MAETEQRKVRVPRELWETFGASVDQVPEADRSMVLRQFMRWYSGEPGARLPERPGPAAVGG